MNENLQDGRYLKSLLADWAGMVKDTGLPQPPVYDGADVWITRLTEKTSEVIPGACFIARVRETSDGHPYIGKAIKNGAAVILAQKPLEDVGVDNSNGVVYLQVQDTAMSIAWLSAAWEGFPSRHLVVIGITGTDGKTSTANIALSIFRAANIPTGLLSTTRAVLGDVEESLALHVTTPEAPIVQHLLRRMVDAGLTHCIVEATSHGLAQHRVGAIDFDLAIITNITHEHLDYHGDFDRYLAAKASLFKGLTADSWQKATINQDKRRQVKTAILNRDDGSYAPLATIRVPRTLSYAINTTADVMAADIQYFDDKTLFMLQVNKRPTSSWPSELPISTPLNGLFNVYNSLAATTAAIAVGIGANAVRKGLAQIAPIDGRMERIDRGQPYTVIVDFAHTPNALTQVIGAARKMTHGRIITVFGSAGKRDVLKRKQMAEISTTHADLTILTAEDPRTDSLEDILQTMADASQQAGGIERQTFWSIPDRGQAIYFALSLAAPEDLVLVCGKGHEKSMCFGTIEYPWDDHTAVHKALEALAKGLPMPNLGLPTFEEEV
jgi:UDP-N-acetylmuramoyl-L-alanyl-D-glutamate--2,6-diaminopimelate ligase